MTSCVEIELNWVENYFLEVVMRRARVKLERKAVYHCMSRIIQRQMLFGDIEKEKFRVLMRQLEDFCGLNILTYSIMTNHFHILVEVPERQEVSDRELIRRVHRIYSKPFARELERELKDLREAGSDDQAEALKAKFTYRMFDISEFMKSLKQRFTQWYNRRAGRKGTLWEERFKSVALEGRVNALRTMAAYIDLNPVRAGLVEDPKDYRYSGYAEAVAGDTMARKGLGVVMAEVVTSREWRSVSRVYRQTLFGKGAAAGGGKRISPEKVREVLEGRGELDTMELLRCRVRYFSDGVVLGSREFVESIFESHREEFSVKRKTGARKMRYGKWGGLCTIRDLRKTVIEAPG